MTEADRPAAFRVYADSYGGGPSAVAGGASSPVTDRWVADDDGEVVAFLRELPCEQFFGGRAVACSGVAAVGVALHARSRGVSRALMTGFLQSLRQRGVPLSLLYASTLAAYRPVGYGLAGVRVRYQLPLEHLPRACPHPVEAWDDDELPDVAACLERVASSRPGGMRRPDYWWPTRLANPIRDDAFLYRYRVREDGRTTGYVVYTLEPDDRPDLPVMWWHDKDGLAVVTRDLVWETPAAAQSLLGFLATQRTLGTTVSWTGPENDPLMHLVPEHLPRVQGRYEWMLRLVDVERALTGRGYPAHVEATVALRVVDDVLPDNAGCYRLAAAGGSAAVTRVDEAHATVDVDALAAIYSGWLSPADAVRLGALRDADAATVDALTALFTGPSPYLSEYF